MTEPSHHEKILRTHRRILELRHHSELVQVYQRPLTQLSFHQSSPKHFMIMHLGWMELGEGGTNKKYRPEQGGEEER
jgi:hypothetical protein